MVLLVIVPGTGAVRVQVRIAEDAGLGMFGSKETMVSSILHLLFCFPICSRTPSYRPLSRRRFYGRPRRFSPPPRRGGGGGRGGPSNTSTFTRSPARAKLSRTRLARSPLMQRSRPANSPPPAPMPPLSERFEALLRSTLRQGRRDYGVLGGLAHLILTNRPKLPLPTLMREAKELSVVIDRNLPPGSYLYSNIVALLESVMTEYLIVEIADPNAEISFNLDFGIKFVIPFPRNTGTKPVFDRPEVSLHFHD